MYLNGITFADGQIALHRVAIALFEGEARTCAVDVQNVVKAIFHVQRDAGTDPPTIIGVDGYIIERDIGIVGIVLNTCARSFGANGDAFCGQLTGSCVQPNTVSGAISSDGIACFAGNIQACILGQQHTCGSVINGYPAQFFNLCAGT